MRQNSFLRPSRFIPMGISIISFMAVAMLDSHARAEDFQPVIHARTAGVNTCLGTIAAASKLTIDSNYTALSTWNKAMPDGHMFQSVVGLNYTNTVAPKAVAVLVASPSAVHMCDATTIQVQPSALPCAALQGNLMKEKNNRLVQLANMALVDSDTTRRYVLMPTNTNGCVIVVVGNYIAK